MLTRPRLPHGVEDRLRVLADTDLEQRIKGDNPEFFGASASPTIIRKPHFRGRVFLATILGCALVGTMFDVWAGIQRSHVQTVPQKIGTWRTSHALAVRPILKSSTSSRLFLAASRKIVPLSIERSHTSPKAQPLKPLAVWPVVSRHRKNKSTLALRVHAPLARPLQITNVSALVEQQAQRMEAMRAQQASEGTSTDAGADTSASPDQVDTGRQISAGSIWSDSAPGGGAVGAGAVPVMIGHGRMGGGGGGSCRGGH